MSRASIASVCTCWRHRGLQTHKEQLAVCHPLNQVHPLTALTLSPVGAATSIIFVATKNVFCRDKSMLAATKLLSRQNTFVASNTCLSRSFVATSVLLLQQKACFVATNTFLSRQKKKKKALSRQIFLATNLILFVARNICRNKSFVSTSIHLSRQKTCFVATKLCRDKNDTCGRSRQWYNPCTAVLAAPSLSKRPVQRWPNITEICRLPQQLNNLVATYSEQDGLTLWLISSAKFEIVKAFLFYQIWNRYGLFPQPNLKSLRPFCSAKFEIVTTFFFYQICNS